MSTAMAPQEIIARLLHESGQHTSEMVAAGPPALAAIISRATERLLAKRFDSAVEVANALRALLSGSVGFVCSTGLR